MNQSKRPIVKDSPRATAEKVSVPILPQVLQIHSKSEKDVYRHTKKTSRVLGEKCRDKPAMMIKLERDIISEFLILILLFSGYLS